MSARGIREGQSVRPLHVVMVCLVVMTVAGGLLLLSAAKPTAPVDGAIEWQSESPLWAVVQLLCLNYQLPTYYAGAVKNFILGIGAGLATIVFSFAVTARPRTVDELDGGLEGRPTQQRHRPRAHVAPLIAAQVLVGLYLLWSFASSRWSLAPELAAGASILLTIHFLWAFSVGHGLSPRAARHASYAIVGVTVVTAAIAVWYHYGRKPGLRAEFPVGNPAFLGACLIPGILLLAALLCERIESAAATRRIRPAATAVVVVVAAVPCLWAFLKADSRGAYVGLVFGLFAMAFFAVRGRWKLIPVGLAVVAVFVGSVYFRAGAGSFSPTGRSATLRLRGYAWRYAWRMYSESPFKGHGQAGFVLAGDSYSTADVLNDPLVFESRIAHAHNEWLEVMADLGSVGIVLIAAALLLTLRAGMGALVAAASFRHRWPLLALMGSLVGLIVEESFGVGLRVAAVGTVFYTVVGLIWALSAESGPGLAHYLSRTRIRRMTTGVVGGLAGVIVLVFNQQDFAAARNVYRAREAFLDGDHDEAIRLGSLVTNRLNPQRALTNLYRLSEAHLRAAQYLHDRARDRQHRAQRSDPPNARLLAMAREDYRLSDEHCERGSAALKELVVRSPGFINHGRLGYWLNVTRANSAAARGDLDRQRALLKDAAAAVKRELLRQPFNPSISVDYVRVAGATLDAEELVEVLARPLRHHRVTGAYMDLLRELAADGRFHQRMEPVWRQARREIISPSADEGPEKLRETWVPEKLRLAAAFKFVVGDYASGRDDLELAAAAYGAFPQAPLGAASCYHELAICQFFNDPGDPAPALASSRRAIALAPESRLGRDLKLSVTRRMIEFYLAAGKEKEAGRLLEETPAARVSDADVRSALGGWYVRLCESLLERRGAGGILRKPPANLAPKLQQWAARSVELNPDDPFAYLLSADLAFYVGDDTAAASHLRKALDHGLPVDSARRFLKLARDQKPDSAPLESLWRVLESAASAEQRKTAGVAGSRGER